MLVGKENCQEIFLFKTNFAIGLPHPRGSRNNARYGLLSWATIRLPTDGYEQIEPLTRIVEERPTSMVTHLKVDADADGSLTTKSTIQTSTIALKKNRPKSS